jgi:hypothetical protein
MELDLSPAKLEDPIVLVKFRGLHPKDKFYYRREMMDISAYFERVWGLLDADLPQLEVYLVKQRGRELWRGRGDFRGGMFRGEAASEELP